MRSLIDEVIPQSSEAEGAVLGWLMTTRDDERMFKIVEQLSDDDFYSSTNQFIYAAIKDILSSGRKVDLLTVANTLNIAETGVAGSEVVERIDNADRYGTRNIEHMAKVIKDKATKRRLIKTLTSVIVDTESVTAPPSEELLARAEADVLAIADDLKDERPVDIRGIMDETNASIAEFKALGRLGYATGFQNIDKALGGLIPSHIWLVGAYTGTGKTFWTIQVTLNALAQGAHIAMFSTEMSRQDTYLRILGNVAGIPTLVLLRGELNQTQAERMRAAEKELLKYQDQLKIYDNAYTVDQIRLKCKRQKLGGGLDIFVLDFVQNLRGDGSIYDRMSNAAVELQQLCKEVSATGIIMSQVSNESGKNANADIIQFKGAGELAAVADTGLWLNKSDTPGKLQMLVRKARHGVSGLECYIDIDYSKGGRISDGMQPIKETADGL